MGIYPPLVTPLSGPDQLDVPGLERLIEHVLDGGVHGLFVLGTTGEGPALSYRIRRELIERTCRQVAGRVPVLVGITDTSAIEALSLAGFSADQGVDAFVLAPPYYFPNSQPELLEYLGHIVPALPRPVFLYNMPTHTKTHLEADTVRRAMELTNLAGIKDSSGNMVYFHHLVALAAGRENWSVLVGPEELLGESVLLGGCGGVCGGANLFPRLFVDLYEAALRRDAAQVAALQNVVMEISSTLYRVGRHGSSFLKGLKCALSLKGICDDAMTEPFQPFQDAERRRVEEILEKISHRVVAR